MIYLRIFGHLMNYASDNSYLRVLPLKNIMLVLPYATNTIDVLDGDK